MQQPKTNEQLAATGVSACDTGDAALPEPLYEQIIDVVGSVWNIRQSRPSKHGFPLLFGYPAFTPSYRRKPAGKYHLIATPALLKYWQNCPQKNEDIFDLPAGASTLARLRQSLRRKFVSLQLAPQRQQGAQTSMRAIRDFAARFDVSLEEAQDWHFFLLDPLTRPVAWWKEPAALAVFRSPLTLREMAETLRISEAQAGRLKLRALALA